MQRNAIALGMLFASMFALSTATQAGPARDCVMEGTLKKLSADSDKVYVAFHSARPAETGARCRMRKREKLHFKVPADSALQNAAVGSRVEYRYTVDETGERTWKLNKVSS